MHPENDRISEFEVKLMDIDSEHLGIPEMEYGSVVGMPSGEFQRIIRDLTTIGDTGAWLVLVMVQHPWCDQACNMRAVGVNTSKEAVKFSVKGDIGAGSIMLRPHANTDKVRTIKHFWRVAALSKFYTSLYPHSLTSTPPA